MSATPSLAVKLGRLEARNPIFSASGTFGYGEEMEPFLDPGVYGGIIGKSISLAPRLGNATPRIAETPSGMLNSIGLQNPGFDAFVRDYLPRMRAYGTLVVVNLVGDTIEEYVEMAQRLEDEEGVDAIELNISCPNCPVGGMEFGIDPVATRVLVERVRSVSSRPIVAKLTPNVTDITSIARAAEEAGADALSVINTFMGMAIDWRRRRPVIPGGSGGLSGPAIKPLALRMVWQVATSCSIPVMGIGGITTADDVMEFFVAGASAVQIGTVQFVRPRCVEEILDDLTRILAEEGLESIADVVGTLEIESPVMPGSAVEGRSSS